MMLSRINIVKSVASNGTARSPFSATLHALRVSWRGGPALDFRRLCRVLGHSALDRGARLDSVSVALGHTNTRKTEGRHAWVRTRNADLERVWGTPSVQEPL
jgi:hypothetical protein